jgi:hypothetical protein
MARQLIVVSREDVGLYHALCADWVGDPDVAVVLDRRRQQRRHGTAAVTIDRRRQERRQHPPLEAHLAWRGGGAAARKSDVLSVLSRGASSIVVRQRPGAKAEHRAPLLPSSGEVRDESPETLSMMSAPANTVIALVILIGTLSGGIVGGLALWLFLAYEFASRPDPHGYVSSSRPEIVTWWQRPLYKLRRSYRSWAAAERSGRA